MFRDGTGVAGGVLGEQIGQPDACAEHEQHAAEISASSSVE
jgi:hypothetical protein